MADSLDQIRRKYHKRICAELLGPRAQSEALTIADRGSKTSITLAANLAKVLSLPLTNTPKLGQSAGSLFATFTMEFIRASLAALSHLEPAQWIYSTGQSAIGIAAFDQYVHLSELQELIQSRPELAASMGMDYLITPDIMIAREPVEDVVINAKKTILKRKDIASHTSFRKANSSVPILHASVSCKWTMRSDRAQNTRTEALNLMRNRKGKTPHIVAVTMEPMPTRLASIAMGTGDVDCTYHAALYELLQAALESKNDDQLDMLNTLVNGKRLRDISDLPFDLIS